jgi:hypothetical protein
VRAAAHRCSNGAGESCDGVGVVVAGLRARRREMEDAIFARVRVAVADSVGGDAEYVAGLRATVTAVVDYVLTGLELGGRLPDVPLEAISQAHRAARHGVGLEAVLRRYMIGQAMLSDYILQEADRVKLVGGGTDASRELLRVQAALADRVVAEVAREHLGELQRAGRSREHRRRERVRALLAGDGTGTDLDVEYDLDAQHVGVVAGGSHAQDALRELAERLDRQLLCVACGEATVWAWLGGRRALHMAELAQAVATRARADAGPGIDRDRDTWFAVGEPAWGLAGWRSSHRQAQEALTVAMHKPQPLTRYGDVALLTLALKDRELRRILTDIYIAPLTDKHDDGAVLSQTLRAYLACEYNASSTAAAMKVARSTIVKRLRTIEERLGKALHSCPPELAVALALEQITSDSADTEDQLFNQIV